MESNSYSSTKEDLSISLQQANYYTLIGIVPIMLPLIIVFTVIWGGDAILITYEYLAHNITWFLLAIILGVPVHEYIHKIGWAVFAKKPLASIEFGFLWKTLTPYAHCTEPMEVNGYRLGAILPGLLLGVLPTFFAMFNGNGILFFFGLVFIFAAGGDFLILWLIRKVKAGTEVEDHPTQAGCYIFNKESGQS
jgi:hypothetical protein